MDRGGIAMADEKNKTIIISKNIINAEYNYNATEENVLTLMSERVQHLMSTDAKEVVANMNGIDVKLGYAIEFKANEVSKNKNFNKFKETMLEMFKKEPIHYVFKDASGNMRDRYCRPFSSLDIAKNSVIAYIDFVTMQFLLYYGKGTGANYVNLHTAMNIRSVFGKRLYKKLVGYKDKGVFTYKIEDIIREWNLTEWTVKKGKIKGYIEKAVESINKTQDEIKVSFQQILEIVDGVGRPRIKEYKFIIKNLKESEGARIQRIDKNNYMNVYRILQDIGYKDAANQVADKIIDTDGGEKLINKYAYYCDRIAKKQIQKAQLMASMKKIINEEYLEQK